MAISKEAAAHTLVWALYDFAKVSGSAEAFEACMQLALHGPDHPKTREAFDAMPTPEVDS